MSEDEIPLLGGKLNVVVRVADTVRRPVGPWSPTVHALLRHLEAKGFDQAPRPLGIDEKGREILTFIRGENIGEALPWPDWVWDDAMLAEVGRATARYHRAVADFHPAGPVWWHAGRAELGPDEIVCHHDIAPYNVVVAEGRLRGIIDWDLVGPGTVRSELAFVAWQWVPLHDPLVAGFFGYRGEGDRGRRLRILLDAYGLPERAGFVRDVIARIIRNRDLMVRKAGEGDQAYARLIQEGHVMGMERAIDFLAETEETLQAELD